ncbi:fms-related tyrosine kinase 3 ligand [Xenopus laevis]|uniref:Fms-related Tyrosine kinase 3 ligand n=2 Tax=Xenopus laevis TaxID=8355 RepID=A0A1L8FH73_XENLA|nr:fms-related tyrosine kinase 3 ligand [Xenopus laevis]XP_018083675.1 fms-related tyrosine kinase 3 ligand [Xenopus laevis]OCT70904.1 hypothetical protein XELAEV_18037829mg [Xenopus laevis]
MNFCHGAHCMIWGTCYMTRGPALVLLLLLFLNKPCLGCNFNYSPLSSTFEVKIAELLKYLPRDYTVSVISNLKPDAHCSDLWMIYFIRKELVRIEGLSGEKLKEQVMFVRREVEFINTECHFNVSEDCRMEKKNVTDFLNMMSLTMNFMRTNNKIKNDFSNCTRIFCEKGASVNDTTQQRKHGATFDYPKDEPTGEGHNSRDHTLPILTSIVSVLILCIVLFVTKMLCNRNTRRPEDLAERQE